jgi:hypothetical protein
VAVELGIVEVVVQELPCLVEHVPLLAREVHIDLRTNGHLSDGFVLERDVHDPPLLDEPHALPVGRELNGVLVSWRRRDLACDRRVGGEFIEGIGEEIRLPGDVRADDHLLAVGAQGLDADIDADRDRAEACPDPVEHDADGARVSGSRGA